MSRYINADKPYDDKRIKCKRDNSIRNVVKKRCVYDCLHYKRKLFSKEDTINDN